MVWHEWQISKSLKHGIGPKDVYGKISIGLIVIADATSFQRPLSGAIIVGRC